LAVRISAGWRDYQNPFKLFSVQSKIFAVASAALWSESQK